jgi:hypothetical protein
MEKLGLGGGLKWHAHVTIAKELQPKYDRFTLLMSYGVGVPNLRKIGDGACWTPYINV